MKCKYCSAETIAGDVCHDCLGNPVRQQWFLRLREIAENPEVYTGASAKISADGEDGVNLFRLAELLIYESPIITDKQTYIMLRFNGKIWMDDAEVFIHRRLIEAEGEDFKPYHLTTLTQMVQGLTFEEPQEPPPHFICFENGILNLLTMELRPHSKNYFFRNMIHAEFNPEAQAPTFLAWLNEVLPNEDERLCIQELLGYCLYRDYPLHYLFFLVGSGRNGRSTLLRTLTALLGKESCASVPLELLPERFQVTNLIGKMVNIVSEPRSRKTLDTPIIKKLTGGDLIEAEIKGKQKTLKFTNYAKIIVLANELPPVRDTSLGWWERVIVIEFPVTIPEEKRIPDIEKRWLENPTERSGIINWALEGLRRLMENRRFTKSEAMKQQIAQYQKWSNPAEYFLNKCCEFAPSYWITKKALYEAFKIVCEEEGLQTLSEEQFSKTLQRRPRVATAQKRVNGKNERIWIGVRLKSEAGEAGEACILFSGKVYESEILRENKTPASVASPASASIGELLKAFRQAFPECFNSTEFFHWWVDVHGFSVEDAQRICAELAERGEVFSTYEGVWRWA
ncbi:MAG: DNA primase family protein [Candidatus Bathyarchaeales archaeon]